MRLSTVIAVCLVVIASALCLAQNMGGGGGMQMSPATGVTAERFRLGLLATSNDFRAGDVAVSSRVDAATNDLRRWAEETFSTEGGGGGGGATTDVVARAAASNAQATADGGTNRVRSLESGVLGLTNVNASATNRIAAIENSTSRWESAYIAATNWLASTAYGITTAMTNEWAQAYIAATNWTASVAHNVTTSDTNRWTLAWSWGSHASAGYLLPASTNDLRQWVQNQGYGTGGAGAVTSVFGRAGNVVAQSGDYTAGQVGALTALETTQLVDNSIAPATNRIAAIETSTSRWESAYINSTNWLASVAYGITTAMTNQWTQGYINSTNWLASVAYAITTSNTNQWTTAFSWGNHAGAGYLLPASTQTIAGASVNSSVGSAYTLVLGASLTNLIVYNSDGQEVLCVHPDYGGKVNVWGLNATGGTVQVGGTNLIRMGQSGVWLSGTLDVTNLAANGTVSGKDISENGTNILGVVAASTNRLQSLETGVLNLTNSVNDATNRVRSLETGVLNLTNSVISLTNGVLNLTNSVNSATNRLRSLETGVLNLTNSVISLTNGVLNLTNSVNSATNRLRSLETGVLNLTNTCNAISNRVYAAVTNEYYGGWYAMNNAVTSLLTRINEATIITQIVSWAETPGACTSFFFATTYWSNRVIGATAQVGVPHSTTGSAVNCSFTVPAGGGLWQASCINATAATNVTFSLRGIQ